MSSFWDDVMLGDSAFERRAEPGRSAKSREGTIPRLKREAEERRNTRNDPYLARDLAEKAFDEAIAEAEGLAEIDLAEPLRELLDAIECSESFETQKRLHVAASEALAAYDKARSTT